MSVPTLEELAYCARCGASRHADAGCGMVERRRYVFGERTRLARIPLCSACLPRVDEALAKVLGRPLVDST